MFDIAIIGGGTAGLTAAIYGARAGKNVAVFESTAVGGQILNSSAIDNYPALPHISGLAFGQSLEKQARDLAVTFIFEEVSGIVGDFGDFRISTEDGEYHAKTLILACGTIPRKLGLANEARFEGRGVSYCATCDGAFFKGKTVAVYGGGDTALHEANYLADVATKVYVINRSSKLRANPQLITGAKQRDNIDFWLDAEIVDLLGESHLEELVLKDGRKLSVSALFVAIGRVPFGSRLIAGLDLDEHGFVCAGSDCKTKLKGVFVAGDLRTKELRQLVTASADGAVAATAAVDLLNLA